MNKYPTIPIFVAMTGFATNATMKKSASHHSLLFKNINQKQQLEKTTQQQYIQKAYNILWKNRSPYQKTTIVTLATTAAVGYGLYQQGVFTQFNTVTNNLQLYALKNPDIILRSNSNTIAYKEESVQQLADALKRYLLQNENCKEYCKIYFPQKRKSYADFLNSLINFTCTNLPYSKPFVDQNPWFKDIVEQSEDSWTYTFVEIG